MELENGQQKRSDCAGGGGSSNKNNNNSSKGGGCGGCNIDERVQIENVQFNVDFCYLFECFVLRLLNETKQKGIE